MAAKPMKTNAAIDYMGDRGVSVKSARFVGSGYIAVPEEPDEFKIPHPKGAKLRTFWTSGLITEPETDVWTVKTSKGWGYFCDEYPPEASKFTGWFPSETAALKAAAKECKERSDEWNAKWAEEMAARRATA